MKTPQRVRKKKPNRQKTACDLKERFTHCGQVLLGETFVLSPLLDDFAHLQGDSIMVQLFCLSVQFGSVLCHQVLFVLPRRP